MNEKNNKKFIFEVVSWTLPSLKSFGTFRFFFTCITYYIKCIQTVNIRYLIKKKEKEKKSL